MKRAVKNRSHAVVALAALLLFVNSALTAWATGAVPATPMFDQFGNPLCITSGEHNTPAQQHGAVSICCTMGCITAPALPVGPADQPSYLIELSDQTISDWRDVVEFRTPPRPAVLGPRAPPMMPDLLDI